MSKRSAQGVKDVRGNRTKPASTVRAVSRTVAEPEQRRLEERIAALEADVAVYRTALEQSRAELQSFAYSVSHDLRAPLRAIEGFSKILLDDFSVELSADVQRFLKNIVVNTETLSSQINDLLRFYRVSKSAATKISAQADAICREAIAELPPSAARIIHIPAPLPEVFADPVQLRQIFAELLQNSVKFSANIPEPKIEIQAVSETEAVRISISDNGAGFDPRYADKLFEVFQKLHPPSEFPGNGIGLAIVKRLVQGHGGCVEAQGVPMKGATFSFTLPRSASARA